MHSIPFTHGFQMHREHIARSRGKGLISGMAKIVGALEIGVCASKRHHVANNPTQ